MKRLFYLKVFTLTLFILGCTKDVDLFTQKWEIDKVEITYSEEKLKLKTEEKIQQEAETIKELIGFIHFQEGGSFQTASKNYTGTWALIDEEFTLQKKGSQENDIFQIETLNHNSLIFTDKNTEGMTLTYSLIPS